MGQLYSKLNQLVINDVDTAADPDRPREKLETAFTTPARPFQMRLPDPRSATQFINRTPIFATTVDTGSSGGTPKVPKSVPRPRYLETDLDDVLPDSADGLSSPVIRSDLPTMTTSTPVHHVQRKAVPSIITAQEIIDSVIEQAIEQVSEMRFSDTGVCEVVTSERSVSLVTSGATTSIVNQAMLLSPNSFTDSGRLSFAEEVKEPGSHERSYAEEVVIQPEDVQQISCIDDVVEVILEEGSDSLVANWSGIGGPDRSVGFDTDVSRQHFMANCSQPEVSVIAQGWGVEETIGQNYQVGEQTDEVAPDSPADEESDFVIAPERELDQLPGGISQDSLSEHPEVDPQADSITQNSLSFSNQQSDSMVVHNDSTSYANHSGDFEWDNDSDSLLVSSPAPKPDIEINTMKNYITPKKTILASKPSGRTPLGDVSTNSPVIQQNLTPKQQTKLLTSIDNKLWKNVRDERLKRGLDAENTPPHAAFNSYPPEVVQSAPGKIRTRTNKTTTKWSNDSLLI